MGFWDIYMFHNGEECLKNIFMQPDMIVLDYDMAELDGIQVVKLVKRSYPLTRMLMVSGQKEKQVALDALRHGASAYISKDGKELDVLSTITTRIVAKQHLYTSMHFSL
jgi:CheY-like chemotaxis protein